MWRGWPVLLIRSEADAIEAAEEELMGMESAIWPDGMVKAWKFHMVDAAGEPKPEAPMTRRRALWLRCTDMYPLFSAAAMRLLSCHPSSCAAERNWSAWGRTYSSLRNRLSKEQAEMIFIKANLPPEMEEH